VRSGDKESLRTCCSAIGVSGPGGGGLLGDQVYGRAIQNKALPAPAEVRRAVTRALQQPVSYPASGAMAERAYQARPVEGVRPVRLSPVTLTSRLVGVPARSDCTRLSPPEGVEAASPSSGMTSCRLSANRW
jgi:hypothetical protein